MEFKLEPYRLNIPKDALLKDVIEVSKRLGKDCIGEREYNAHGLYSSGTIRRRFGSWSKAMEMAGLKANNWQNVTDEEYIQDIKLVAERLGKKSVTQAECNDLGKYSASSITNRFETWLKALAIAGLEKTRNIGVTEEEYFQNLEKVWRTIGRQPAGTEMRKPLSAYSVDAYADRFGTWRKALEAFVDYVNRGVEPPVQNNEKLLEKTSEGTKLKTQKEISRKSRHISWRLRFLIMRRDGFRCCMCGRSPATEPGIILHIDHAEAWSKDGPNTYDNLQTLCSVCNIGKSDLDDSE